MLEDSAATRNATRARIGPWYVMQSRNPSAPGMKFATLVSLIRKGHVSPRAIVRGPTTQQLWTFAVQVRGISRELGLCWHCGNGLQTSASSCAGCGKSQEIQGDPDAMLETTEMRPRVVREIPVSEPASHETVSHDTTATDISASSQTTPETIVPSAMTISSSSASAPDAPPTLQLTSATSLDDSAGTLAASDDQAEHEAREALAEASALAFPRRQRNVSQRSSPRNRDDTILSASELAAAFQLNVPRMPSERRRRPLGVLLVLLLLAGMAAVILLAIRPDYRSDSMVWVSTAWSNIKAKFAAPPTVKPAPIAPKPVPSPLEDLPDDTVVTAPPPTKTAPPVNVPEKVTPPTPPTPAPQPVVEAPAPTPPPAPQPAVVYNTSDDMPTRIRKLRNAALDAEGRNDYREAVRFYEQIRQFPRDSWPGDLQVRLNSAKERMR